MHHEAFLKAAVHMSKLGQAICYLSEVSESLFYPRHTVTLTSQLDHCDSRATRVWSLVFMLIVACA
jgi:hypothetical protein